MFAPRTLPLALDPERLLGLRLSLNTPVVATPELPTGPARAAIVSHLEGGMRRLTVAVRSLRNGASVLYDLEGEDLEATRDFSVCLDAALSFGESMGFLFDDDELQGEDEETRAEALRRWREVAGATLAPVPPAVPEPHAAEPDSPPVADPAAQASVPAALPPAEVTLPALRDLGGDEDELLLDEVADDHGSSLPREPTPLPPATPGFAAPGRPAPAGFGLTKFRAAPPTETLRKGRRPRVPIPSAAPVGRVRLLRRPPSEAPRPASPLLRLLACF